MELHVAIIGAGPAGASCARILAEKGFKASIFDHLAPWEKPCGGILGPSVRSDLIDIDSYPYPKNTYTGIRYESSREHRRFIETEIPFSVVSRRDMSRYMLDTAVQAGSDFRQEKVTELIKSGEGWKIHTDNKNEYIADIIIGADGTTGITRKKVSRPFEKRDLNQSCGYFMKGIPKDQCIMKFPGIQGYLWVVSCSGHTSAGILAKFGTTKGKELFKYLDNYLAEHYPEAEIIEPYAALIPALDDEGLYNEPCCGANWILTGDAAGHNDPILGEGIYYALESGRLAAEAIIDGDISSYDDRWREIYGEALSNAADFRKKVSHTAEIFGEEVAGAMLYNYFTGS